MKYSFSKAAIVAALAALPTASAVVFKTVDEAYNPGEERGSFDLVMKPFPIPVTTTTYVDFIFNIPDDAPDVFHVTLGEIINSQPDHLHHFVLTGCPEKIDPAEEGLATDMDVMNRDCPFNLGGWAPGADIFANTDLEMGFLLGRGVGVQAIQMNTHYTDGAYADEGAKTLKMATDGIRVHYTPALRPYSSIAKYIINVAVGPSGLAIPPGEERYYISRTCNVETRCSDASEDTLSMVGGFLGLGSDAEDMLGGAPLTCETLKPFCGFGEGYIVRLCPQTCGVCDQGPDGEENPFNPDAYRVTAVHYHAHLLGREMYTTLIRGPGDDSGAGGDSDAAVIRSAGEVKDLESRDFWIFDNQEVIPLEFDVVNNDTIMRGTEIRPGDKIQATCVFDSMYRTEPTEFYLSTYDEMCMTQAFITFPTPASLLSGDDSANAMLDMVTQLNLLKFACADDESGDVYSGILTADEDGRDIWKDHPVESAQGCKYETLELMEGILTMRATNCGQDGCDCDYDYETVDFDGICEDMADFQGESEAGATCTGGTLDGADAMEGATSIECVAGGGVFSAYTCEEAQNWLSSQTDLDAETVEFLVDSEWGPKCCGESPHSQHDDENNLRESLDEEGKEEASPAASDGGATPSPEDGKEEVSSAAGVGGTASAVLLAASVLAAAVL